MHSMFPPTTGLPQDEATSLSSSAPSDSNGRLPSLHAVVVQLDSKFITEITHTAALFAELFPPGGRKRLVKVRAPLQRTSHGHALFLGKKWVW